MGGTIFITGNSSGLGRALTEEYLQQGHAVYGLSRRGFGDDRPHLHDVKCDLAQGDAIVPALNQLLSKSGDSALDLVILNAGVLGEIRDLATTPLADIRRVMDINVWANKAILDWLVNRGAPVTQIVLISSGAAVNGNKGWGAYSLSKATVNMLAMLYAHELPDSHLAALAPGLVDTAMQDYLCDPSKVDEAQYPTVAKLRHARNTQDMPEPKEAAHRIAAVIPKLKDYPSGSFVDIRTM